MPTFKRDTLLGLVFFGGLLLLLWATARLSNFSLAPHQFLKVHFPEARGLAVGDRVYVLGTPSGIVSNVEFDPGNSENRIRVTLQLGRQLTLRRDYRIRIESSSLLGGRKVSIYPGSPKEPVIPLESTTLVGEAPPSALEGLGEWFAKGETQESLSTILGGLADIVRDVREGRGTIGKLLKDSGLYDEALGAVSDLRKTIADVRAGKGSAGRLFTDDRLYEEATGFFASARKAADAIDRGEGIAAYLLHDATAKENLAATLASVKTVSGDLEAGRGMLGRILRDPRTEQRFDDILANIDTAAAALNEGEGVLPALLHDGDMRTDLKSLVANVRGFSDKLAGSTFVEDLERVLGQLSRSIEDAREAAPVSTFFTIFGGVFQ